jgi:hypothetical protein
MELHPFTAAKDETAGTNAEAPHWRKRRNMIATRKKLRRCK